VAAPPSADATPLRDADLLRLTRRLEIGMPTTIW
jgi:hypothetical protein